MESLDKKSLSERDICTKFITPAIHQAGWTLQQFREEVKITAGRVVVRGNLAARIKNPDAKGGPKRADYVLFAQPDIPLAVIEAKQAKFSVGHGMQQALAYAEMLDAPFAISSNGAGFLLHDRTGVTTPAEREIALESFPSPDELWGIYRKWRGLADPAELRLIEQPYFTDASGREPRYYQRIAINRVVETVAKGQQRILLVMATGTGKTYTAFQIIWRLWKAKAKKRILFLADRNILVDQTMQQDFAPFSEVMHKITNREVKKNYEIYLALYQAVTGKEEWKQIYRQFPSDFFDLIVVDECHRGSAADDSAWREVLGYFNGATHLGLTATPKETKEISNITYFGEPIYTYSLRQGIEDGFLAPYKVIRIITDVDALGYTPEAGKTDKHGRVVEQRHYNTTDFDRNLVLTKRTELVARRVWEYLQATDPMAKTIVFCDDQDHAERMRQALVNIIPAAASNRRYVMRITGDDNEGKAQLSYFIDNDEPYPVIATTSKLLTTGIDAKTCKLIVLDQNINSMAEFKQIVGRGTRIREDYRKLYFTIMDFKGATRLFADPEFDGEPVVIYEPKPGEPVVPPESGIAPHTDDASEDSQPPDGIRSFWRVSLIMSDDLGLSKKQFGIGSISHIRPVTGKASTDDKFVRSFDSDDIHNRNTSPRKIHMTVKATLAYGKNFHFYHEALDDNHVYLELEDAPFDAGYKRVMIAIPIDIWETIRDLGAANLNLVSASDEELARTVEEQVGKRIEEYANLRTSSEDEADMLRFNNSVVFGAADDARDQQVRRGIAYYKTERERQREVANRMAQHKIISIGGTSIINQDA